MIRTTTIILPAKLDKTRSEVEVEYEFHDGVVYLRKISRLPFHLLDDSVAEWITEQLQERHAAEEEGRTR